MNRFQTHPGVGVSTFPDILTWRVEHQPDRLAYTFLVDGETERVCFTYSALAQRAWTLGAQIKSLSAAGDRVLLLYPPGLEYIAAFFGCLYTGRIAAPAYPPRLHRPDTRLQAIVADSEATVALTTKTILNSIEQRSAQMPDLARLRWLATDDLPNEASSKWDSQPLQPNALAFLQYTSGSTATPKGARVTHRNLMHNAALMQEGFEPTSDSCLISWLPPYHDMGLIGSILQPLYVGFPAVLMAPTAFLQSPVRWLRAISQHRGTVSGGPNFAYDWCVSKITPEQRAELDLTAWEIAFNGSEPIHAETLDRFVETFAPYGFRREAFYPCYGLAEGTLIVSGGRPTAQPKVKAIETNDLEDAGPEKNRARRRVGCGRVLGDQQLEVVEVETFKPAPAGQIGEIWIRGASIVDGYWQRPDDTRQTFAGYLESGVGPFLRTGDLGFVDDGELFIAGRLKDLIIIRGRNYYPQDIELTIGQSHPALKPGGGAAFSAEVNNAERLVVVNELERLGRNADVEQVVRAVRQAVVEQHGLQVYAVVLIRPGHLPRTSSGKVARRACQAAFLAGQLDEIGRNLLDLNFQTEEALEPSPVATHREALLALPAPERRDALATILHTQAAQALQIPGEQIDLTAPLVSLGLDSLLAAELAHRLEMSLEVGVSMTDLLAGLSLNDLADQIYESLDRPQAIVPLPTTLLPENNPQLSFEQERLWLLHQLHPDSSAYNIPLVVRLNGVLDLSALLGSLNEIIKRHSTLRTQVAVVGGQPALSTLASLSLALPVLDVQNIPNIERETKARQLAIEEIQRPFDLAHGPLIRACLIRLSEQTHLLVITIHHIVCDLWSLVILLDELGVLYQARVEGGISPLPDLHTQYADFVAWQRQWLNEANLAPHLAFWNQQLADAPLPLELPTDQPRLALLAPKEQGAAQSFILSPSLAQALNDFSRQEGVTLFMTLLTAFAVVLQRYSEQNDLLIGSPVAGRPRPELERLIGFFAYPVILRLNLSGAPTLREMLQRVRQTALAAYAHQSVPFAKIVAAAHPDRQATHSPLVRVMFGFLNQPLESRQWAGLKVEPLEVSPGSTDFDIFLTLTRDEQTLQGVLAYDPALFHAETIQQFSEAYQIALSSLIEHPETSLAEYRLPPALEAQASRTRKQTLAIAATFTAEPVKETLSMLMQKIGRAAQIQFAPYNQVYQQLLDPTSLLASNTHGVNILLLRFEDWLRFAPAGQSEPDFLERNLTELVEALKLSAGRSAVPWVIGVCPNSPASLADQARATLYRQLEERLVAALNETAGIYIVPASETLATYPVANYYDAYTDQEGHIPYTPIFFSALGTMLARKIHALQSPSYKVIVLDCDQTLWKGVCGEVGALGVEIDPPRKALQEFMVAQGKAGMLLCLNSKNNEADVWEVFDRRPDMVLRREQLVAWRINWRPKSENLRALAQELQLGLDSFIFLDDDPVECAEVQASCPEVLTLQLPREAERIPRFLAHVWAFDHLRVTAADQERTALYRQNAARERSRQESATLEDFLASLGLEAQITELQPQQLERVAQLAARTNQFNFTTIRWSESELREQCLGGELQCLVVEVRDRFGDYGLVGVMIFKSAAAAISVHTCLLSCRALGRGVERQMLARLGQIAQGQGLGWVEIHYRPTPKNQPALEFLESVGALFKRPHTDGYLFAFPAEVAANLCNK